MKRTTKALALLAMLAFGTTQAQLLEKATPQERELLQRVLGISDATQFMPGALPEEIERDFGASLRSLPNARVIGSVVQGAPNSPYGPYIQSHVVAATTAAQVDGVMATALRQGGWQNKYPTGALASRNAFASTPIIGTPIATYCKGDRNLNYFSFENQGTTSVSLSVNRESSAVTALATPSGCPARTSSLADNVYGPTPPPSAERQDPFANWPLPRLAPPSSAHVQETGSSASMDFAKDMATVFADATAAQVFDHYVAELRKAGWRLTGRKVQPSGEIVAGFNFRFQDRELQGRLSMTPKKDQAGRYDVQLESFGR